MKKIEELIIDDKNMDGVFSISFVENPAMEEDFIFLSKNNKQIETFAKASEEKHMVYAPAIIPDKKIRRFDENGNEYFVFFSKETTNKLAQNYLKNHFQDSFTFEHAEHQEGASVVESWIIADSKCDKANKIGFNKLPEGTWMVGVHINSIELWEQIKNKEIKGLSIEAFMARQIIENSLLKDENFISKEEKLINDIKDLLENFE